MRRPWLIVLLGLVVLVAVVGIVLLWPGDPESESVADDEGEPLEGEEDFAMFFDERTGDGDPRPVADSGTEGEGWRGRRGGPRGEDGRRWDPAGRAARRERFRNMSPEQRQEWMRRRIQIEPYGDGESSVTPDAVMKAMRDVRPQIGECIRENGGFRQLFSAMRAAAPSDGGVRRGMSMSFEVDPSGQVSEGSIALEPPPPEPFYDCFATPLATLNLGGAGGEGAQVTLQMGGGPRGRGRRGGGEAGGGGERGGGGGERGGSPRAPSVPTGASDGIRPRGIETEIPSPGNFRPQ